MRSVLTLNTVLVLLLASIGSHADDSKTSGNVADPDKPFLLHYPNLENSDGEVVLSNEHVVLQRLVVPAGKWEGIHSHPGNQIYVHIRGGEWSGRLGGEIEYSAEYSPDGEVGWMDAIPLSAGHDSGNTGDTPIDLIYVTLKSDEPIDPDGAHAQQDYPAISTQLLLENDRMIVQRVRLEPGEWTGVHRHPGNQVYIHISGGTWSERRAGAPSSSAQYFDAGAVGWIDATGPDEAHETGNSGDTTIDFVLVTIK